MVLNKEMELSKEELEYSSKYCVNFDWKDELYQILTNGILETDRNNIEQIVRCKIILAYVDFIFNLKRENFVDVLDYMKIYNLNSFKDIDFDSFEHQMLMRI